MTVYVWDERRTDGPWTQCSECGYLMGLIHGGYDGFPLGAYTDAERDALTGIEVNRAAWRAAEKPMFPLIDDAAQRRYRTHLRAIAGTAPNGRATAEELRARLQRPGNLVVLPGTYRELPDGHRLRRWQPGFTGGHMVAVLVRADRSLLWLDPLATTGYAGDVTDLATAMIFAYIPSDAHEVQAGELTGIPDTAVPEDVMLKYKAEGWRVADAGAVVSASPGGVRMLTLGPGVAVTSVGETEDGAHRCICVTAGGEDMLAYARRVDLVPMVPGGDAAFDASVWRLLISRKAAQAADCTAQENKIRAAATAVAGARRAIRAAADSLE